MTARFVGADRGHRERRVLDQARWQLVERAGPTMDRELLSADLSGMRDRPSASCESIVAPHEELLILDSGARLLFIEDLDVLVPPLDGLAGSVALTDRTVAVRVAR